MVKRTNGLSGQSTELPQFAALVYDHTMYMSMMTEMKDKETKQQPGFSDNHEPRIKRQAPSAIKQP